MTVEGAVGIAAGIAAGSVALIGFGLSSAVEGMAAVIVIWRFTGSRTHSETSERSAQKAVAISFWLLAPYVAVEAVHKLLTAEHPETSIVGIALTAGFVYAAALAFTGSTTAGGFLNPAVTLMLWVFKRLDGVRDLCCECGAIRRRCKSNFGLEGERGQRATGSHGASHELTDFLDQPRGEREQPRG